MEMNKRQNYEARLVLNNAILGQKRKELEDLLIQVQRKKEAIRDYEQLEQIYKSMILEDKSHE